MWDISLKFCWRNIGCQIYMTWYVAFWIFLYQCYYPHRPRDSVSPVCRILKIRIFALAPLMYWHLLLYKHLFFTMLLFIVLIIEQIRLHQWYLSFTLWVCVTVPDYWSHSLGDFFCCSKTLCMSSGNPEINFVFTPSFRHARYC